jgi:hypothetical protein
MEFREKIEAIVAPLVTELRENIGRVPTLALLEHYQFRIHTAKPDKSNIPDGVFAKWRYVWALRLSAPKSEGTRDFEKEFPGIDELVEKIFDTYGLGAVHEPGRNPASETEFLARLGFAIKVRELDGLAFPEQLQKWALARLSPFDTSYFLPRFGIPFADIVAWLTRLLNTTQRRLTDWVDDLTAIAREIKSAGAMGPGGKLNASAIQDKALAHRLQERLEANAKQGDAIHTLSIGSLFPESPPLALQEIIKQLGIKPGEIGSAFAFPHQDNPLAYKTFVLLPDGSVFFLDPANAYRNMARSFEKEILGHDALRSRYLKNRDRATERWTAECMGKMFPGAEIYPNYFLKKGMGEKDIFVRYRGRVFLIECKNSRIRPGAGKAVDPLNFASDFEASVQFAFDQALEVKQRAVAESQLTFLDEKGRPYFSIKRGEIDRIHIMCVTVPVRGPLGTDLSFYLGKPPDEPFPLVLNLFDLDTISGQFDADKFISYIEARERLHGNVSTGDELNYAGYFLKYGNLEFEKGTLVSDDFSGIFDRVWYRGRGIEVEEPSNSPVLTHIARQGDRIRIEDTAGNTRTLNAPPWVHRTTRTPPTRMKGSERNKLCPCGSGKKLKHCHGAASRPTI